MFCCEISKAAECHVVTPTELQVIGANRVLPYGHIDAYEGLVLSYSPPDGRITGSHRYPSTFDRGAGRGWVKNPD